MTSVTLERLPRSFRLTTGGLERRCSECHEWKAADRRSFVIDRSARLGVGSRCLFCNRHIARQWRKENPRKACVTSARRRARDKQADGIFTEADREQLLAMYGHHCLCCSRHETECGPLEIDHVIPPPIGTHDISNRQPLCSECNRRKRASSVDYRTMWIRRVA